MAIDKIEAAKRGIEMLIMVPITRLPFDETTYTALAQIVEDMRASGGWDRHEYTSPLTPRKTEETHTFINGMGE